MKKLSNQEFNQVLVRLLGSNHSPDFEIEHFDLMEWLRARGSNEDDADQRIIGLALLNEAARRLAASVHSSAEFEALLADAHAFLVAEMQHAFDFEIEAEPDHDD